MRKILTLFFMFFVSININAQKKIVIDTYDDWLNYTSSKDSIRYYKTFSLGGESDLIGNGALLLDKNVPDSLFALRSNFAGSGKWVSKMIDLPKYKRIDGVFLDLLAYGKNLDMREGWVKFKGNPLISGANNALPFNKNNITNQTIILPNPPGGLPQDQSIVKGSGKWEGKYILFFNHSPTDWPYDYYWSFAVSDSLSPLKKGINPFKLELDNYPTVGPLDGQAPNDWMKAKNVYFAPDETNQSDGHMWVSNDLINWKDLGVIQGKEGTDPGMTFDGYRYHLFNEYEYGPMISHCYYDPATNTAFDNSVVADVGDHSGDPDVVFFNNQWHMFMDDGEHLHYSIAYGITEPDYFPKGWKVVPNIYGPYNPDNKEKYDDDNDEGNRFGTGDADVIIEDNTLYMFTERPVMAAYKELTELLEFDNMNFSFCFKSFESDKQTLVSRTDWINASPLIKEYKFDEPLTGDYFQIYFKVSTENLKESPMLKSISVHFDD